MDKQLVFPDKIEVESSTNAFDMLSKMSLPRLIVDPVNRTVKTGMDGVQLRINGIRTSTEELVSLL